MSEPRGLDGLIIRPVRQEDCEGLMALFNAERAKSSSAFLHFNMLPESIRRKFEGNDPADFRIVALQAECLIGQASLSLAPAKCELTILVRRDYRSRGIASALLSELIEASHHRLGLKHIEVDAFADNLPAIKLYEKLGFEIVTRHIRNDGCEILSMRKIFEKIAS